LTILLTLAIFVNETFNSLIICNIAFRIEVCKVRFFGSLLTALICVRAAKHINVNAINETKRTVHLDALLGLQIIAANGSGLAEVTEGKSRKKSFGVQEIGHFTFTAKVKYQE
jgi:hypothetical protein